MGCASGRTQPRPLARRTGKGRHPSQLAAHRREPGRQYPGRPCSLGDGEPSIRHPTRAAVDSPPSKRSLAIAPPADLHRACACRLNRRSSSDLDHRSTARRPRGGRSSHRLYEYMPQTGDPRMPATARPRDPGPRVASSRRHRALRLASERETNRSASSARTATRRTGMSPMRPRSIRDTTPACRNARRIPCQPRSGEGRIRRPTHVPSIGRV